SSSCASSARPWGLRCLTLSRCSRRLLPGATPQRHARNLSVTRPKPALVRLDAPKRLIAFIRQTRSTSGSAARGPRAESSAEPAAPLPALPRPFPGPPHASGADASAHFSALQRPFHGPPHASGRQKRAVGNARSSSTSPAEL